jgi:hypothetical protein
VRRPTPRRLLDYVRDRLRLGSYLAAPGDGRQRPRIPASCLLRALLIMKILRTASLYGTEMLVRYSRTALGLRRAFGDDALAYFLERLAPEPTRCALIDVLRRAKRNKAFENAVRIGIALDGTGVGRTRREPCAHCHPCRNARGEIISHGHLYVVASVVGTGIVLPFDAEPIVPGENELTASKRLLRRAIEGLGVRFADCMILDSLYAGAPFVTLALSLGLDVVVGLSENMPDLLANARAHFAGRPPDDEIQHRNERVELWDAEDVEASQTLPWPSVRVLYYRRHRRNGDIVEGHCFTTFSRRAVGTRALFAMRSARWEIENETFNDLKNRYGLEHIPHHEPNSLLLHVLLTCLAVCTERLYRQRYLHRGTHPPLSAIELFRLLWLHLLPDGRAPPPLRRRACHDTS